MFKRIFGRFGVGRLAGLCLLFALLALRVADPTVMQVLRSQSFDLYQRIKPRPYQPVPVAILDIDEASIQKLGQWPWPRTRLAELVDKVTQLGAVAVGFDIVFAEPDRLSPEAIAADNPNLPGEIKDALTALPSNDKEFANSISRSRIVVGQTSTRNSTDQAGVDNDEIRDVPHAFIGEDPIKFLPKFSAIVQNRPELEDAALGRGVFSVVPDADGVFRKVPLVFIVQDKIRLSLSTELLRVALGGRAFALKTNVAGIEGIKIGRNFIQTNPDGAVWPYFSQSVRSRFISAKDVLDGSIDPNLVKGRMLLVGTSAIGLEDYRATPMGSLMAGVEIHAQVMENIMANTMLVRPNYAIAVELLTILVIGLLAIIFVPMLGAAWSFVCASGLIASYLAFSWLSFDWYRYLIDPVFPVASTIAIFVLLATINYLREEQQRRQIKGAFGQYVSPALVSQLSDNPEGLKLGGETRDLSVLFSDVRGFTAISESFKTNPQGLTELMNRFLTVLSDSILRYDGTIDKFMGDAVMAFWNAPVENDKHASASCEAAIDMIADVAALNKTTKEEYDAAKLADPDYDAPYHEINVGIGINSGGCVVGNMGSENRFDYTALGDAVNLASRLEGQSKPYGIKIVLGQATAEQVLEDYAVLEIDQIRVKGKQEPETIYGLFGRADLLADKEFQELQNLNNSMLKNYRSQDWETASALLDVLGEQADIAGIDIEEFLFIYRTRILEFSVNPPGQSWDGVYNATSK